MSSASQLQFPAPAGQPDPPSLSGGSRSQAGTSYPLLSALICFCKAVCCPRDLLENSADPGVELDPKNGATLRGPTAAFWRDVPVVRLTGLWPCRAGFLGSPVLFLKHRTIENFQIHGFSS